MRCWRTDKWHDIRSRLLRTDQDGCNYTQVNIYRIVDDCGNSASCTQYYTYVIDHDAPFLSCPEDLDLACSDDIPPAYGSLEDFLNDGGAASDECDLDEESFTFARSTDTGFGPEACVRTIARVYIVADECGNTSSCTHTITITDTDPPFISCPDDLTIDCGLVNMNGFPEPDVDGVVANDDCTDVTDVTWVDDELIEGDCAGNYSVIRTFKATDLCGNMAWCTQTITVIDTTGPELDHDKPDPEDCIDPDDIPDWEYVRDNYVIPNSSDNCSDFTVTLVDFIRVTNSEDDPQGFPCWTSDNYIYTGWDECGNPGNVGEISIIYRLDTIDPVIVCEDHEHLGCDNEEFDGYATWQDVADYLIANGYVYFDNPPEACDWNLQILKIDSDTIVEGCDTLARFLFKGVDGCLNNSNLCIVRIPWAVDAPIDLVCPADLTLECADETNADQIAAWEATFTAFDACAEGELTTYFRYDEFIPGCGNSGIQVVTFIAEDTCTEVATCKRNIIYLDRTPPSITCPEAATVECVEDVPEPDENLVTADDSCGDVTVTWVGDESDGESCPETITRTYKATDECNNMAWCTQYIYIHDMTPPTITCPDALTVKCAEDVPDPNTEGVGWTDNCEYGASVSWEGDRIEDGTCEHDFTVHRKYLAVDECGNTASCTQVITVHDDMAPMITCPDDFTLECDEEVPEPNIELVSASDNCAGEVEVTWVSDVSDGEICPETITRTYKATDVCGNMASCTQKIRIYDTTAPVWDYECQIDGMAGTEDGADCPADAEISLNIGDEIDVYTAWTVAGLPVAGIGEDCIEDNCTADGDLIIRVVNKTKTGDDCEAVLTVAFEAEDECENVMGGFTCRYIIKDDTKPTATCPMDMEFECLEDIPAPNPAALNADDNCTEATVDFISDISNGQICPETVTRTYVISDECGNSITCTQKFLIHDMTPPSLTCPDDMMVDCMEDVPEPNTELLEAADNCEGDLFLNFEGDEVRDEECANRKTIVRTYSVMDLCENVTYCTQYIYVDDQIAPSITCPEDLEIECSDPFPEPNVQLVLAWDNCEAGYVVTWVGDESDGLTCPETITRTYRATDACGNSASCTQKIIIDDTQDPYLVCPETQYGTCDISEVPAYADFDEFYNDGGNYDDNCEIDMSSFTLVSEVSDGETCPETFTRTYRIADACGNTASCTQYIVIDDHEGPSITCPEGLSAVCDISEQPPYETYEEFTNAGGNATDNCGIDEESFTLLAEYCIYEYGPLAGEDEMRAPLPDCPTCPQVVGRVYQVSDLCGNVNTCFQVVMVNDEIPPTITCPDDLTFECDETDLIPDPDINDVLAADNCGDVVVTYVGQTESGDSCDSVLVRTYKATDACGNMTICTQTIHILDTTGPELDHDKPQRVDCIDPDDIPDWDFVRDNYVIPYSSDNCNDFTVTLVDFIRVVNSPDHPLFPCYTSDNYIYGGWDECGNPGNLGEISIIYRLDTIDPVIVCENYPHLGCDNEEFDDFETWEEVADFLVAEGYVYFDNPPEACDWDLDILKIDRDTIVEGCDTVARFLFKGVDGCLNNSNLCIVEVRWAVDAPIDFDCPDDLTLECADPTNEAQIEAWLELFEATDNCSSLETTFSFGEFEGDCGETGMLTVTYSAIDTCGKSATCTAKIIVEDTTDPIVSCPDDLTIECGESTDPAENPEIAAWLASATGTDECSGPVTLEDDSYNPFGFGEGCGMTGMQVVTFYLSDECGNIASCTAKISIEDTTPPDVTCPDDLTIECGESLNPDVNEELLGWLNSATGSDVCGSVSLDGTSYSEFEFGEGCGMTGMQVVTFYLSDDCGNEATCTAKVSIVDTTPPTITCPDDLTIECLDDKTLDNEEIADWIDSASGDDDCGMVTITHNYDPDGYDNSGCGLTGMQVVTFVATDDCGLTTSCTAKVFLVDETPPVILCPPDAEIECDSTLAATGYTAFDLCGDVSVTFYDVSMQPGTCPDSAFVVRTFIAEDDCGNTASCTQHILVVDTEWPEISCPDNVTISCTESTDPENTGYATATDNCDPNPLVTLLRDLPIVTGEEPCTTAFRRVWRATDRCGNGNSGGLCEQIITVVDDVPPSITCPDDLVLECDSEGIVAAIEEWLAEASASDECNDVDVDDNYNPLGFTDGCGGITGMQVVTFTAMDECGNIASCTAKITIVDNTPPVVTCPDDLTLECGADNNDLLIQAWLEFGASGTDACGGEVTFETEMGSMSEGCGLTGMQVVTFIGSDECGNTASCTAKIIIVDNTPPVLVCPPDMSVECSDPIPMEDESISADNCGNVTTTFSDEMFEADCPDASLIVRTYFAEDDCGNTNSCTQHIFVVDTEVPIVSAPDDVTISCEESLHPDNTGYGTATDNCDPDPIVTIKGEDVVVEICPGTYLYGRVWEARDRCGNGSTGTTDLQLITVVDVTAPSITCPADATIECDEELPEPDANAIDNCDPDPSISYVDSEPTGSCPQLVVRTYTATDWCGNTSTCTQHIYIEDTTPPVITECPDPALVIECGDEIPVGEVVASDACSDDLSVTYFDGTPSAGECGYSFVRTFWVSDECGNSSSCQQVVQIVDTTPPTISCPDDTTIECGEEPGTPPAPPASDICVEPTVLLQNSEFRTDDQDCGNTGVWVYTWRATDDCGNAAICTQRIYVEDTTGPALLSCPENEVQDCEELTCISFAEDDNGVISEGLITGLTVDGVNISISATSQGGFAEDAWIVNTTTPPASDPDLGSPNILYGGLGINSEDPDGYQPSNNRSLGNAVIVQRPGSGVPNDYELSESLTFEFDTPVYMSRIANIDIETPQANNGAGAFFYDESDTELAFVPFAAGPDNNLEIIDLDVPNVSKMVVYFGDTIPTSGGVAGICFIQLDKPEPVYEDECGEVTVECTEETTTGSCNVMFERTWTAMDECGNAGEECVQTVTVENDAIAPTFTEDDCVFLLCTDEIPDPDPDNIAVTDNCTDDDDIVVAWVEDIDMGPSDQCEDKNDFRRIYTATDECGNVSYFAQFFKWKGGIEFVGTVYMQAPWLRGGGSGPDTMGTDLLDLGYLPNAQPYNVFPWNYAGSENFAVLPATAVDWVLVRLTESDGTPVDTIAAMVLSDGSIIGTDGNDTLKFDVVPGEYHVQIIHRNHLDIETDVLIDFTDDCFGEFDYTADYNDAGYLSGLVLLGSGKYAMWAGDADQSNTVSYNTFPADPFAILLKVGFATPNATVPGYNEEDVTFDGITSYNTFPSDPFLILLNVGFATPNAVIFGHLY